MEKIVVSLCPGCTSCPEVVIEGDHVRIGEAEMGPPERMSGEPRPAVTSPRGHQSLNSLEFRPPDDWQ